MGLKELFSELVNGIPLKRKCWKGYWKYENGILNMYCKDGMVVDFLETSGLLFTFAGVLSDDWEIATKENSILE